MTPPEQTFRQRHKLAIQALALGCATAGVLPIYLGLQAGAEGVALAGLALTALGMGIGLWGS